MEVENRKVNPKLIQNIEDLKSAVNQISVYDLNTYTAIELYYRIANKLNEVIEELLRYEIVVSEQVIEQNDCLQYLLNEGLTNEVINKINKMVEDGTMDKIVNENVFQLINTRIDKIEELDIRQLITVNETDNTTEIINALSNLNRECIVNIPYGIKFNQKQVYEAIPIGIILKDNSLNSYKTEGYRVKNIGLVSGDVENNYINFKILRKKHHN